MFEQIERVPGDAILGLIEAFKKDTNPQKVDLASASIVTLRATPR